jgi:RNA polymerase sigma-54 factor
MALAPRLDLRQSQSLVMTPQLQQAIKLLTLSSLEIDAFIAEELERNPLLELASGEAGETDAPELPEAPKAEDIGSDQVMNDADFGAANEALDISAESFEAGEGGSAANGADGMLGMNSISTSGSEFGEGPDFDAFAAPDISLRDHLMQQAGSSCSGRQLLLVEQLIEQIEPSGWLGTDVMALAYRLGVPQAELDEALVVLQGFDPTGVGARDLAECIALQAKEADRYDPCMARLIDNLDLVARGSFDQLMRLCRVDEEDLRDMLAELRGYDPKPGLRFDSDEAAVAVTPDIYVNPQGHGWAIELNSANLPRLLVNRSYYAEVSGAGNDKAANNWLNEALADANWLIKAMDQRQRTIMKVAAELVKQQEGFFREGVSRLKPLTLRQVAEAIDMHESTVSRVTSNKYLHCPRGLFDLKYFFSSGVASADGDGASAEAVKAAIKTLIDGEAADDILSDDTLVDLLKEKGFDIARRTVAKYREAMGMGSSVQRRRAKKMGR